jgi:hypothetical protein
VIIYIQRTLFSWLILSFPYALDAEIKEKAFKKKTQQVTDSDTANKTTGKGGLFTTCCFCV